VSAVCLGIDQARLAWLTSQAVVRLSGLSRLPVDVGRRSAVSVRVSVLVTRPGRLTARTERCGMEVADDALAGEPRQAATGVRTALAAAALPSLRLVHNGV
jgi:hypothetical protein